MSDAYMFMCFNRQCELFRVLRAYSLHNKIVGYTQGMASVTAEILIHVGDEEASTLSSFVNL